MDYPHTLGILLLPLPYLSSAGRVPGIDLLLVFLVPLLVGWIMQKDTNRTQPDEVETIPTIVAEGQEQKVTG